MTAHWATKPLGEICDVLDSKRKPVTKSDRKPGPFPYYGATGVLDYVADYIFDEKLVLIGEDGAKWAAGENTAFIAERRYWVNNHAHVIRPRRSIVLDEWIVYYINASDQAPYITGLTVPKLNQAKLCEIPIPLPPTQEQKRIVAILDEAFAGIATATANAEKNLANARDLFESYLQRIFARRGANWRQMALAKLCERITVGHVGSMAERYTSSGVPFLRSQNIRPFEVALENVVFIDDVFHSELQKSKLNPGDIAVVRTGYPGTAAVIPPWLTEANCSDLVLIRPGPELNPNYLAAFFNSAYGKELVLGKLVGAAQKHFNVTAAKEVELHFPPLPDQDQIVAQLHMVRTEVERLKAVHQRKLAALNALKQAILQKAFSGELSTQYDSALCEAAE